MCVVKKLLITMALVVFVFMLFSCTQPDFEPSPDSTPRTTPDSTPSLTPNPTIVTPEPTVETPAPTPDPTVETPRDPETQLTLFGETLPHLLPNHVNADFTLPRVEGFDLVWSFEGQPLTHVFPYHPPLFDRSITLTVQASYGDLHDTFSHDMMLIAPSSGLNENVLHIQVDIPISDVNRDAYRNAAVTLFSTVNDRGEKLFDNAMVEIRGRGNSTWGMPKRPYRLKFANDVSILGMPEARNYVLLAEYADKSLLRNTVAFTFSGMLRHVEHAPSTRVVEVYFNGEYHGVYTLTEHTEIHQNKLWFDADTTSLDAGFLFELDRRFYDHGKIEGIHGFNVAGVPYVFKAPSPGDDLTPGHIDYIKQYVIDMESALIAKEGYEAYLDIDNFIDYFIVQELFKNVDVGWGSVFAYKRPGEVLRLGPIWDFDLAIGNADYIDYGPENWYGMRDHKNRWFQLMMDIPQVRAQFRTRYIELYHTKIFDLLDVVESMGDALLPAAERNFERWDILGHYVWPNPPEMLNATTYQGQLNYLYDYIEARATWMYHAVQSQAFHEGDFE